MPGLTFDIVRFTPSANLATSGTFVFTTPKAGALYAQAGETLVIPAMNNVLDQAGDTFTIAYGASTTHTLTYTDATTVPAGSEIQLQLPLVEYKALVALTDSSGGTASDTIAAVPGSYTQATLANQFASTTRKINQLVALVNLMRTQMDNQNLLPMS